jgi:poly-gamma-glutamate capsule biosynthesis protein CapA/YwtB (metallophosphatase superfamily)
MPRVEVVATGDAILTHPISANPEPGFAEMVELLRGASVTISNLEMVFPGRGRSPSTTMHGTPLGVDPEVLSELKWLGIDIFGMANNHATDYGVEGLVASLEELERRGMLYAGAGRTLREARAPRYFDTPGGRVALVAAGSSNARLSVAADPGIADVGRAGIAPIRLRKTHFLGEDRFLALREILAEAGVDVAAKGTTAPGIHFPYPDRNVYDPPLPGGFAVDGVQFAVDEPPRVQTDALEPDVEELIRVVTEARRQADLVFVALHCHEGASGRWNNDAPAEFMRPLAHRLIDAGAHGIFGHGPHMLRGVELYEGRPICYSLGNFVFNLETIPALPVEVYTQQSMPPDSTTADLYDAVTGYSDEPRFWESVVPQFVYEDGELVSANLRPVTLGRELPRGRRGCPQLAEPGDGTRILGRLDKLSAPFGARVEVERSGGQCIGRIAPA